MKSVVTIPITAIDLKAAHKWLNENIPDWLFLHGSCRSRAADADCLEIYREQRCSDWKEDSSLTNIVLTSYEFNSDKDAVLFKLTWG